MRYTRIFALSLMASSATAFADAKEFYYQRAKQEAVSFSTSESAESGTFDQFIAHNDLSSTATFKQRYFIDSRYAAGPNSPVLYYVCGEATCSVNQGLSSAGTHAASLKAHIVTLEHRYYGLSQPFPELTAANLKHLSTANAVSDLASFQKFAQSKFNLRGKWIVIGGSYAGSLAAFYREKHPELVVGALASSAPVRAHENYEEYDKHVTEVVGETCGNAMRAAVGKIEDALGDVTEMNRIKKLFKADDIRDNLDFLMLVADIGASAIQYGFHNDFCEQITKGDALAKYAAFAPKVYSLFGVNAVQMSMQGGESLDPKDYLSGFGMRQWLYQSCTEYGYWQNAHHDASSSVRSAKLTLEYARSVCKRLFNLDTPAQIDATNRTFYDQLLTAPTSQIFFTNGGDDPWSVLSIDESNGNAINPNTESFLIPGAAHCDDLGRPSASDSAALKQARSKFSAFTKEWIK